MNKFQKSVRGGIQDFLCPFTDMYITQGSNNGFSHKGIMANDVRGIEPGVRYPYYAPCDLKCIKIYPDSGQSMWQSINPVRCANGKITMVTAMIAHSNSQDCYPNQVIYQGDQWDNMGDKGNATGVHCHIQTEQGDDISWYKNEYGIYQFNNEVDLDDMYFVDNTNIIEGMGGNWKITSDVPVASDEYINIPPSIEARNIYNVNTKKQFATIKPKKFGGLSYKILAYVEGKMYAEIETHDYGKVLVKITDMTPITNTPQYSHGNY